jgi:hypothetical protein
MLKHGASRRGHIRVEYNLWRAMKRRCCNPNSTDYFMYGGRGIGVCLEWLHDFEQFYADMGPRPYGMQLDRIDNSLGYSKSNCRWATPKEQARNRRSNVHLTAFGDTRLASEWAKALGILQSDLFGRLKRGRSLEDVIVFRRANGKYRG